MTFSTYDLMDEGLALTVLSVAAISLVAWVAERAKQRRLERRVAEMKAPASKAIEPQAVSQTR